MAFWWERQLALYILSDFPGIKNPNGLNDLNSLNNLSGRNDLNSLISSKKNTELDVFINPDTKLTYSGFLMFDGLLKIHYFIDFWHHLF